MFTMRIPNAMPKLNSTKRFTEKHQNSKYSLEVLVHFSILFDGAQSGFCLHCSQIYSCSPRMLKSNSEEIFSKAVSPCFPKGSPQRAHGTSSLSLITLTRLYVSCSSSSSSSSYNQYRNQPSFPKPKITPQYEGKLRANLNLLSPVFSLSFLN